jgi:hypothetical protein
MGIKGEGFPEEGASAVRDSSGAGLPVALKRKRYPEWTGSLPELFFDPGNYAARPASIGF